MGEGQPRFSVPQMSNFHMEGEGWYKGPLADVFGARAQHTPPEAPGPADISGLRHSND